MTWGYPEPTPDKCVETGWHSKLKHSYVESYVRVWPEVVGEKHGTSAPYLTFVDLNASYGWCYDPEKGPPPWEGTAIILAHYLKAYPAYKKRLILNSWSPDETERASQLAALREALSAMGVEAAGVKVELHSLPVHEALDRILPTIEWNNPSVWIVDPYKASEMPWSLVERIIANTRSTRGQTVHPDMFLSLMTIGAVRNPHTWARLLGLDEAEVERRRAAKAQDGLNDRELLTELYKDRLNEFYGRRPFHLDVPVVRGQVPYAVVFASDHPASYFSFLKMSVEAFENWRPGYEQQAAVIRERMLEAERAEREEEAVQQTRRLHGGGLDAWQ